LVAPSFEKIPAACQVESPPALIPHSSSTKGGQLFIRAHNETLSVAAGDLKELVNTKLAIVQPFKALFATR
jgi:hypothetical protein